MALGAKRRGPTNGVGWFFRHQSNFYVFIGNYVKKPPDSLQACQWGKFRTEGSHGRNAAIRRTTKSVTMNQSLPGFIFRPVSANPMF